MCPVSIVSKDANFAAASVGYDLPVADAAWEYLGFYGSAYGADCLTRNLVSGKPSAQVVGAPPLSTYYATFTGAAHYLQTAVEHVDGMTVFAIAEAIGDTTGAPLISNNGSISQDLDPVSSNGIMLYLRTGAAADDDSVRPALQQAIQSGGVSTASGLIAQAPETPLTDTPALFVGRAQSGAKPAIRDWTNAESDTLATNTVTTIDLGQELRIGSQYNDVIADAVRIHCAGIISEVVSDADMATIYARLSAHMSRRSITI